MATSKISRNIIRETLTITTGSAGLEQINVPFGKLISVHCADVGENRYADARPMANADLTAIFVRDSIGTPVKNTTVKLMIVCENY